MKKSVKVICCIIVLLLAFTLGWRIMPKIWPGIKETIFYPIFPQLKPKPTVTPELYAPKSDTLYGDDIYMSDSVIYYFYKDYCPWCRQLEPLTAGLPKQITLVDGRKSSVKLICLNKVEDRFLKIITEYYNANNVPEDRQYVPAMVIGDRYLFANDEIINQLMDALMAGEGVKTLLLDGNNRIPD